jgi:hypothetical protein
MAYVEKHAEAQKPSMEVELIADEHVTFNPSFCFRDASFKFCFLTEVRP